MIGMRIAGGRNAFGGRRLARLGFLSIGAPAADLAHTIIGFTPGLHRLIRIALISPDRGRVLQRCQRCRLGSLGIGWGLCESQPLRTTPASKATEP